MWALLHLSPLVLFFFYFFNTKCQNLRIRSLIINSSANHFSVDHSTSEIVNKKDISMAIPISICKGMEAELYEAAVKGLFEAMSGISNWKEQQTPIKDNILHIHVGKHVLYEKKGVTKKEQRMLLERSEVSKEFIEKVMEDNEGHRLLWESNANGDTPLHLAARFGHSNAVEAFLDRASKVNQEEVTRLMKMSNKKKDTALHEAARGGHHGVVELLVLHAHDCLQHKPNEDGETPLYLAAERGCTDSVLSILSTCNELDLAFKGPCGRTALHAAVQCGNSEMMVSKMLEKDDSLVKIRNDEGLTPLHCVAAEIYKQKLLKVLVKNEKKCMREKDSSSAVYIQDNMGRTALHIAMLRKNWEAMDSLIECCPDCIDIVDDKGQNVLHYAAKWTCLKVMEFAVTKLKHVDKLINNKDNEGNTPFHVLAYSIRPDSNPNLPRWLYGSQVIPFLDLEAFNKDNLTVGDILMPLCHFLDKELIPLKGTRRGRRINRYEEDVDVEKATLFYYMGEVGNSKSLKAAAQNRLVVAALIATVSFTAGFTLPGGYNQNAGKSMGMAVFRNNILFQVFLVSDTIAFSASMIAIILYFVLVSTESSLLIHGISAWAFMLITISIFAMMIAFVAGVAVVSSKPLNIVIAVGVSLVFVWPYLHLMFRFIVLFLIRLMEGSRLRMWNRRLLR